MLLCRNKRDAQSDVHSYIFRKKSFMLFPLQTFEPHISLGSRVTLWIQGGCEVRWTKRDIFTLKAKPEKSGGVRGKLGCIYSGSSNSSYIRKYYASRAKGLDCLVCTLGGWVLVETRCPWQTTIYVGKCYIWSIVVKDHKRELIENINLTVSREWERNSDVSTQLHAIKKSHSHSRVNSLRLS